MGELPPPARFPAAVEEALVAQLHARQHLLAAGASHVGWKIARSMPGVDRFLGPDGQVFGYLTSATVVEPGGTYRAGTSLFLRAETELVVTVDGDVPVGETFTADVVADVGVALEIVDVQRPVGGMGQILAENAFHRAVAFGPSRPGVVPPGVRAHLAVNGRVRESGCGPDDVTCVVADMAAMLRAAGQCLRAGDRILAGSLTHVPVHSGDEVTAIVDGIGSVAVTVTA